MKKGIYYTTNKPSAKKELILYFVITFGIMYGLGAVGMIFRRNIEAVFGPVNNQNLYVTFLICSPTISSLVLTAIFEKRQGLITLLKRAVFSTSPVWWAVAFLFFPALWCIYGLFSKDFSWHSLFIGLPLAVFSSQIIVDRGPLCEELGWRGFALPRLLQYFSPLVSAVILSVIWGLFHLIAFLTSGKQHECFMVVFVFDRYYFYNGLALYERRRKLGDCRGNSPLPFQFLDFNSRSRSAGPRHSWRYVSCRCTPLNRESK